MVMFLYANVSTCQCFYMLIFLHANVFTCQYFYMAMFLYNNIFTYQCFYIYMFIHIKRMCKNPHKRFALHILSAPAKSIFTLPPNILLFIFAALVSYCARCLTCRLARCLALTTATLFHSIL